MTTINQNMATMPKTWSLRYKSAMKASLLGGVFFLPLSLNAAVLLLILSGILLMGRMVWTGEMYVRRTPLDVWVAGFVFFSAASVWQSAHAAEGWYNCWNLVGLYMLVYGLITQTAASRSDRAMIILSVLASSAIVCAWGLMQYYSGIDVSAERWIDYEQFPELKTRIFATLGNPNVLASFLVMVAGLASGWALDANRGKNRSLLAILSVLAVVCILLTYSRGAWLALGVMALAMTAVWKHWNWRILLAVAVAAAVFSLAVQGSLMTRLLSIKGMFNPADSSVALRWALWESTLAMIAEHPWLGLGWGSYRFVYPEYDFFVQNESVIIYHGHNTLLSLAAEIGIPGMLCFAVAWGMSTARAFSAMRKANRLQKGFFLGIVLALVGTAAFSLTDHALFNIQVAAVFWVLLALTASLPVKEKNYKNRAWFQKKFKGLAGIIASGENNKKA